MGSNARILIVDDEPHVRTMLERPSTGRATKRFWRPAMLRPLI